MTLHRWEMMRNNSVKGHRPLRVPMREINVYLDPVELDPHVAIFSVVDFDLFTFLARNFHAPGSDSHQML